MGGGGKGGEEWNGGLAGEHVRRENAIHNIHRHVVSACVYVSQSKRGNHPVPQEGGWEIEWPYIHKDIVCVWQKGKPSCSTGGAGGRVLLPPWPARTVGKPQNRRGGGGRGCRRKQSTKPRRWGKGMPQKQRDILFHRGGGRGEYTMPSLLIEVQKYITGYHMGGADGGGGGGGGGGPPGRNHI